MADSNVPAAWGEMVEALHTVTASLVARTRYPYGHPVVSRADGAAGAAFAKLHERLPEMVIALVDGEFILQDRPMPGLRERLAVLADAFHAHGIEALVFMRGLDAKDVGALATVLSEPGESGARARDRVRAQTRHVLVRFVESGDEVGASTDAAGAGADYVVPEVEALLYATADELAAGRRVDVEAVRGLARRLVARAAAGEYRLYLRSYEEGFADFAGHAVNVASMTAAMLLDAGVPGQLVVDGTSAALVHDLGQLLLPPEIRGVPQPMLDARGRKLFEFHPFLGARALLAGGAPALWVAASLEHHRGVDGLGYPALTRKAAPHDAVRVISLADFVDDKRTMAGGAAASPDDALGEALSLAERYFDPAILRLFMRAVGAFPPGTTVELSDGTYAVVTRPSPIHPRRPQAALLFGPNAGRRVDLSDYAAHEQRFVRSIVREVMPPLVLVEDEPALPEAAEGDAEPTAIDRRGPDSDPPPSW